jgi:two-component system sensor histidine kinase HydH
VPDPEVHLIYVPPVKLRVPPLALAFALMAAALIATAWTTRGTVDAAFDTRGRSEAVAVAEAMHADLAGLDYVPDEAALGNILRERSAEGLRYIGIFDRFTARTIVEAGQALGGEPALADRPRSATRIGGRWRVGMRAPFPRGWGRAMVLVTEIEPVEIAAAHRAASRTLAIGVIAALTLLGVAVALARRELRRSADEAAREHERRLASLGEMSAVLAHEIKNPLASLKGNAQLLAAALPEGDRARAKAERVVDEARRLEQLTQDLLAFVRTGELARADTDVVELVRAAAGEIPLELDAPATHWSLDRERMREVLANLIVNAADAGPAPVRARVSVDRDRLVVEVADHGPGVAPDDRARIFEPFFTKKTRGTGLGLAIARRIVTLHGGSIEVGDDPAGGAVFRIAIPR